MELYAVRLKRQFIVTSTGVGKYRSLYALFFISHHTQPLNEKREQLII